MHHNDYLSTVIKRLKYYKDLGEKAMEQMDEAGFHYQPNPESNSVAIIVRHLHGNMMSRWTNFLTEDGDKPWRNRDLEFEGEGLSVAEVKRLWNEGWNCLLSALESLKPEDLEKTVHIRQEPLTVVDAINRQLAHYPYHVGQIVYLARMLRGSGWKSLSIPKGGSDAYNRSDGDKDPARKFS